MKILAFWDVYWRIWRKALKKELPFLVEKYKPDFVIANVDNATSGRGIIEKHILEFEKMWVDIMTSWDHFFDNFHKFSNYLERDNSKLLRCANFYDEDLVWVWDKIFKKNWKKLLVIHLQWEVFMKLFVNNPFREIQKILKKYENEKLDWIILDFHKEVTSEIKAMWQLLDWKISLLFWTHTHIQTNDETILENGTWYITDLGMNWAKNSIIWAEFDSVKSIFLNGFRDKKMTQSLDKNYIVSGIFAEIWDNWFCKKIEKIRVEGKI